MRKNTGLIWDEQTGEVRTVISLKPLRYGATCKVLTQDKAFRNLVEIVADVNGLTATYGWRNGELMAWFEQQK